MFDITWLIDIAEDDAISEETAREAAGEADPVEDTPLTFEEIFGG